MPVIILLVVFCNQPFFKINVCFFFIDMNYLSIIEGAALKAVKYLHFTVEPNIFYCVNKSMKLIKTLLFNRVIM